jgi:coatomer protein complex subunit epsilon
MSNQTPNTIASLQLTMATLLALDGPQGADLKAAVKCIHTAQTMEHQVMLVQLYLRMDRVDIAQKQVMKMKQIDEDCTLTTMAQAWVNLASQPQKAQEAAYIYEELSDKYGASCMLLNGQAAAKMHLGAYDEAETLLTDALNKNPGDNDTLANLIVVGQHISRDEEITQRYLTQLKKQAPNHQLVTALAIFEGAFDRVGKTLM